MRCVVVFTVQRWYLLERMVTYQCLCDGPIPLPTPSSIKSTGVVIVTHSNTWTDQGEKRENRNHKRKIQNNLYDTHKYISGQKNENRLGTNR